MKIEVDGKFYKVVETLPYHGIGRAVIIVDDKEKVVVKEVGKWRFWTVKDRLGV